jgi:hypothetical protein
MKPRFFFLMLFATTLFFTSASLQGQSLKDLIKKKPGDTTSTGSKLGQAAKSLGLGGSGQGLTATEVANGLKEALEKGATKGTERLSAVDGFLGNAAVKILMPPEARKVEETLRKFGLGSQVDQAITSMNRAAEDAAKSAAPIFVNAIKSMTIEDAFGILRGGDTAATAYLRRQTTSPLTEAFRPVIDKSLAKVDATKYWNTVFSTYNRFSKEKVNTDLPAWVTERALSGIFLQLAQEEAEIRKNPAARTSELLKKVFGSK